MTEPPKRNRLKKIIMVIVGILAIVKALLVIFQTQSPKPSILVKNPIQQTTVNINLAKIDSIKPMRGKVNSDTSQFSVKNKSNLKTANNRVREHITSHILSKPPFQKDDKEKHKNHVTKRTKIITQETNADKRLENTQANILKNECQIIAIPSYHYDLNESTSETGEIFVYTYCDTCHFRVRVDKGGETFDVFHIKNPRNESTLGYLPVEYQQGFHSIEIIDIKKNCNRLFPPFHLRFNQALYIEIKEDK